MRPQSKITYIFSRVGDVGSQTPIHGQGLTNGMTVIDSVNCDGKSSRSSRHWMMLSAFTLLLVLHGRPLVAEERSPSFEATAIEPAVAPLSEALTFARIRMQGGEEVVLVADFENETLRGVPVSELGISGVTDPIDAAALLMPRTDLDAQLSKRENLATYSMTDVLSAAGDSTANIGTGTNFPEHAEEARLDGVFSFPKFGRPMPPRTQVFLDKQKQLLDYEVEMCVRFDRTLKSIADFDSAMAGFFLCADFTDRAEMIRRINVADPLSGIGFTDGKSGPDYFPTGPFLVVPRDWRSFIANERIVTEVDGQQRQDARGREMILDFRKLVDKILADDGDKNFSYKGEPVSLTTEPASLPRGVNLMSGTAEGVVYRAPTKDELSIASSIAGQRAIDVREALVEVMFNEEREKQSYLQPGSVVAYRSMRLGEIKVKVAATQ
ncbi:MAG TPA: fumarylacetoacetate hydrolase family protein [Ochrobactrum intermedium]|uniref:Fumarylacetoacetate hydrolase family protein n=1 Tax=Brucella intermedia TaxID=94625 RepID=A0A7V6TZX0_9HYPH|nr:fumarylacetoacetate hydrolase family protein [Brucella intermedia]HHV68333.1 fumarylacetoacetate hydrolase family protein [Brucella intermedia]